MPPPKPKMKIFKNLSRKIRSQTRKSVQKRPASCSKLHDSVGSKASLLSIPSKSLLPASPRTLDSRAGKGDTGREFEYDNMMQLSNTTIEYGIQRNTALTLYLPQKNTMANVHSKASLMGMPVELRIMIFKLLFPPRDSRGMIETTIYLDNTLRSLGQSYGQLCRVNRQIYEETKGLLYGQTLVFLSHQALTKFNSTRTREQMFLLQSICMKPRVTDWSGAIKTLVLPPGASLTVHWPIEKNLWQALISNNTLDYRHVNVLIDGEGSRVVFEPVTASAKRPTYNFLEKTFNSLNL